MAAEKKPRAAKAKAETKTTKTTATKKAASPKPKTFARKPEAVAVTGEQIAERAYYLWVEGSGDDPFTNWIRAEGELQTS